MFRSHLHVNYVAVQASNQAASNNLTAFGTANFHYDASLPGYILPGNSGDNATINNLESLFLGGPILSRPTFGPGAGSSMSQPNSRRNFYGAGQSAVVTPNFSYYISTGTASTCSGDIVADAYASTSSLGTFVVKSAPTGAGVLVGAILSGGSLSAGTWIQSNVSGGATDSSSTWIITNTALPDVVIATSATTATYTITPIIMTVTNIVSGMLSVNGIITGTNITANTFVTNQVSGTTGGTGTYYVSYAQGRGTAAAPVTGSSYMSFLNFDSADGFHVAMTNSNVLYGYTYFIACKVGSTSTANTGIIGTDHGFGVLTTSTVGECLIRNSNTWNYRVTGTTATGATIGSTGTWHIHSVRFDGSQPTTSTRFVAKIDGVASTLTFLGSVSTQTVQPASITTACTTATVTGGVCTVTFGSWSSPPFNVGQTVTLAGWTTTGTGIINGTQTVTAVTNGSISFSTSTTISGVSVKGTLAGIPVVNLYVDGLAPITYGGAFSSNNTTAAGLSLGEFIWYNSALGDSAMQALEKKLRQKWLGTN